MTLQFSHRLFQIKIEEDSLTSVCSDSFLSVSSVVVVVTSGPESSTTFPSSSTTCLFTRVSICFVVTNSVFFFVIHSSAKEKKFNELILAFWIWSLCKTKDWPKGFYDSTLFITSSLSTLSARWCPLGTLILSSESINHAESDVVTCIMWSVPPQGRHAGQHIYPPNEIPISLMQVIIMLDLNIKRRSENEIRGTLLTVTQQILCKSLIVNHIKQIFTFYWSLAFMFISSLFC